MRIRLPGGLGGLGAIIVGAAAVPAWLLLGPAAAAWLIGLAAFLSLA
jgi:hypothetical protein